MKLNKILENMDSIPSGPAQAAKFNDTPKLTREEKLSLMEKVGRFNEHAAAFESADAMVKLANELAEISKLGKTYAMNEGGDWFQTDTIKRDFGQLDKITSEFTKCAKECFGALQRARALYEDAGHVLERYYEIKDMNPTSDMPVGSLPPEEAPMEEIIPNEMPAPIKLGELGINW